MDNNDDTGADATSAQLTLMIPGVMLAQIDAYAGSNFVDREDFIRAAIRHYVETLQQQAGVTDR